MPQGRPYIEWRTLAVAFASMSVEGYDLAVFGSALPVMTADPGLSLTTVSAGWVGSAVFCGMLIGGLLAGWAGNRFGLRWVLPCGIAIFSLAMVACGAAPDAHALAVARLVAGTGLGVVMPGCMSMTRAVSTARTSPLTISIVMAGIPMGGIVASAVAYLGVAELGWRPLFVLGAILGAVLLPFVMRIARNARPPQIRGRQPDVRAALLSPAVVRPLVAGALATFCFLLSFYGLVTWLTKLMTELEIPLHGALQLTLSLNTGAVVGSVVVGLLASRYGALRMTVGCGLICAACLVLVPSGLLAGAWLLIMIVLLGMTSPTSQNLVNALISNAVPAALRTGVLGVTLGIGRTGAIAAPLLGSALLTSVPAGDGLSGPAGAVFVSFAISSCLGVAAATLLGATKPGAAKRLDDPMAEPSLAAPSRHLSAFGEQP